LRSELDLIGEKPLDERDEQRSSVQDPDGHRVTDTPAPLDGYIGSILGKITAAQRGFAYGSVIGAHSRLARPFPRSEGDNGGIPRDQPDLYEREGGEQRERQNESQLYGGTAPLVPAHLLTATGDPVDHLIEELGKLP
jgi:hypothetical protein